jgi:hypothetical protein
VHLPVGHLMPYLTRIGPVAKVLSTVSAQTRARVIDALRRSFEPFIEDDAVRYTAARWIVEARLVAEV